MTRDTVEVSPTIWTPSCLFRSPIGLCVWFALLWTNPICAGEAGAPSLPFTLSWTHGTCVDCKTARQLIDVEFVDASEARGIGYVPPGGETGAGNYSVLHTRDGGRTWSELPGSLQHNDPPSVSFSSQREGWVMIA